MLPRTLSRSLAELAGQQCMCRSRHEGGLSAETGLPWTELGHLMLSGLL